LEESRRYSAAKERTWDLRVSREVPVAPVEERTLRRTPSKDTSRQEYLRRMRNEEGREEGRGKG
jgi:hypothetical protein